MSLKELTWEKHKIAERQDFANLLLSGKINPKFYANFLANQLAQYQMLETLAEKHGHFDGIENLKRSRFIENDIAELGHLPNDTKLVSVINEYLDHLLLIERTDNHKLLAHMYVRYMGDLYGGQMIARKVPGSAQHYRFENSEELKNILRSKLTDDLADEANLCFDFVIEMYKQLMILNIPKYIND